MAVKKKSSPKDTDKKSKIKKKPPTLQEKEELLNLDLPDEMSEPATNIEDYNMMIFGPKGIGKTSLASRFNNSLTMAFEPGGKALRTYQRAVPNWIHFRKYIAMLSEDPGKFTTVVIDTAQIAYNRCMDYACEEAGISHPSEGAYGAGWKRVAQEFERQMNSLMSIGMGIVAVAHDKDDEVETKSGRKFNKMIPALTGQCDEYFSGPIDVVGYYHYDGEQRWLQIRGSDYVTAKCRLEENFIAKDGQPVFKIPMGTTPDEAYSNLVRAFNNKQEDSYIPDAIKTKVKAAEGRRPKKKKRAR